MTRSRGESEREVREPPQWVSALIFVIALLALFRGGMTLLATLLFEMPEALSLGDRVQWICFLCHFALLALMLTPIRAALPRWLLGLNILFVLTILGLFVDYEVGPGGHETIESLAMSGLRVLGFAIGGMGPALLELRVRTARAQDSAQDT